MIYFYLFDVSCGTLKLCFQDLLSGEVLYHIDMEFIRFKEAEEDCTEALNLDDRYIKAYSRRITARKELGKLKEAMDGIPC